MKATKKIVGAACALVAAVALSAGSTFAWFAANTSVSATGMNVTAKSNASYLLISDDSACGTEKKNENDTALSESVAAKYVTSDNDSKTCYPVTYCTEAGKLGSNTAASAEKDNWYTANSDQYGTSSGSGVTLSNITKVTQGDKDYMLTYNAWLTLSDGSANISKYIKVSYTKGSNDDAVSIALTINSGDLMFLNSTTSNVTTTSTVALTSSSAIPVVIYVYIDGTAENVNSSYLNTNGASSITGTVSLGFSLVDSAS